MKHLTILMTVLNQSCYDSLDIMKKDWASTPVQLNFLDLITALKFPKYSLSDLNLTLVKILLSNDKITELHLWKPDVSILNK